MNSLLPPLINQKSFQDLLTASKNGKSPLLLSGVLDSQKTHLIYGIEQALSNSSLIVASSELRAREIFEDLKYFSGDEVSLYPSKDIIFYNSDIRSMDILKQRFQILDKLIKGEKTTIVLSIEALFDRLTPKDIFQKYIINIKVGDIKNIDELVSQLISMGYERRDLVESCGQFARRGGIIDLYTTIHPNPIRIEFWDDEIDSIRIMDAKSQRSVQTIDEITVFPIKELLYTPDILEDAIKSIEDDYTKAKKYFVSKGLKEESEILTYSFLEDIELLKANGSVFGVDKYFPYFYKKETTLLDYLPENTNIFLDELNRIKEHSENVTAEFSVSIQDKIMRGYMLPAQAEMISDFSNVIRKLKNNQIFSLATIMTNSKELTYAENINFDVKASFIIKNNIQSFTEDLTQYVKSKYTVVILAGNKTKALRLQQELLDNDLNVIYMQDFEDVTLSPGNIYISKGSLKKGFEYPHSKFIFITNKDIFGEEKKKSKKKFKKDGSAIESFADLRLGDYIVHENHGIGIFKGIEKVVTNNISKDYIKIGYADGGNLYVPTTQMDIIQKYLGGESIRPKMNKLGGQEWVKTKTKTKKNVEILAKDLLEIYARREKSKGYQYSADTVWQTEFEELFPFEETDDQITAIEDVKRDMESNKVMDRLICGDVGYGKTEVAIRSAFKAVQDGKQVAYLVPTTILAQQHFNTFSERMKDFPIDVGVLSRFSSKANQQKTLEDMASGKCDIVIGTHRLLSKDVKFKDLGLLIVDEEQRFGVGHKEKLKAIKENIDILTLTATPIPRTLHMSLSGIRDMSVLEEPPLERIPIQTYVMEQNFEYVKDAIHRELARNGQVYYLHNRVNNISETASKIQNLVPEAEVSYAHGQMSERDLENIMKSFIDGEIDVLVCTTIIETGLDISNVNTIIIEDADNMGLSQLYQLRGRVGRSNKTSFAYLMYKRDKVLKEIAEKRLQTLKEFTEFGSGFKIAMRDLELRGAGSVLGGEQHGHMDAVGYDLYCKLLDKAVKKLKGISVEEEFETTIDINVNAFIPPSFIKNEMQKLEIYKKISNINSLEDYYNVQEEIEDRFGDLPKAVQILLEIALLKCNAHKVFVTNISQKDKDILIYFKSDANIDINKLGKFINDHNNILSFKTSPTPVVTYKLGDDGINYDFLNEFFKYLS